MVVVSHEVRILIQEQIGIFQRVERIDRVSLFQTQGVDHCYRHALGRIDQWERGFTEVVLGVLQQLFGMDDLHLRKVVRVVCHQTPVKFLVLLVFIHLRSASTKIKSHRFFVPVRQSSRPTNFITR
ncbi:hypothetical protein D3C71_1805670 [compost metagenome]